jgi:hypothetical protein
MCRTIRAQPQIPSCLSFLVVLLVASQRQAASHSHMAIRIKLRIGHVAPSFFSKGFWLPHVIGLSQIQQ